MIAIYLVIVIYYLLCMLLLFKGKFVALVTQYPKKPKDKVILYGELLYACRGIISEFEFFM